MLASWRRSGLIKRLWKLKRHETESENEEHVLKSTLNSVLKRLSENQLEHLVLSIESKGGEITGCVNLTLGPMKIGNKMIDTRTFLCGVFRWPQLLDEDRTFLVDLDRLDWCSTKTDEDEKRVGAPCCNPHHHTIVVTPQLASPTRLSTDDEKDILDCSPASSTETGGTPSYQLPISGDSLTPGGNHRKYWCVIAYWEHRKRQGRLYPVHNDSINIFQNLPHGDGVSLQSLQTDPPENENVRRTRDKIGLGLVLSRRESELWCYNRSDYPIFINSPTLDNPDSRTFSVHKLNSGYSMRIFDYAEPHRTAKEPADGPYDPCAIRISFGKGWGGSYSRQFVTSCPCWLEVLLRQES